MRIAPTVPAGLLFSLFAVCAGQAQVQPHTRAVPSFATGYYDGTASLVSSGLGGRSRGIFQNWFRGDTLPRPTVILQIGDRPRQGLTVAAFNQDLEITLSSTTATFSGLSTTFANNLANDAVVFLRRKMVNLPALTNHTDPNAPSVWIPGDQPFIFIQGPHFLMQLVVQTEPTARSTGHTPHALGILGSNNGHAVSDTSCGGQLNASYTGGIYTLDLSGAQPNGPALFMLSANKLRLARTVPLPLDLSPLGMPGCILALDPLFSVPLVADALGNARLAIPFGLPPDTLFVHTQALHGSTATPLGLATSNVATSTLGDKGLMNYVYNFNDVTPVATSGPFTINRRVVFLYR